MTTSESTGPESSNPAQMRPDLKPVILIQAMSSKKNPSETAAPAPALKYHRHGTWDMIDVPIAIRSTVGRPDPNRSGMPSRPSASQLLFHPKPPVRHPAISEVCSKFESFSRGSSRNFGLGQTVKSREWKRSSPSREASADMQIAINHQADIAVTDRNQLPIATERVHDPKADHIDMVVESEISDQISSLEPMSGDQGVIESLQATASVNAAVSERLQQADDSYGSSWSSSEQDPLSSETATNQDLSRESSSQQSGSIGNPIDVDSLHGEHHTVVEQDNHSDGIPVNQAVRLDGNDMMALYRDSYMGQVQEDLAEVDVVDHNHSTSFVESHSEDGTASGDGPSSSIVTPTSDNVRHDQQSLSFSSPVSVPLSDQAEDPQESATSPSHHADLARSRDNADHAAVEFDYDLPEASSEARATVRDISALFRLQEEAAESSDSGISNSSRSSSRRSRGRHLQRSVRISEPAIQEPVQVKRSTAADLDDDILDAAMRSLSLNFDSDTDSPSDPAPVSDRAESRSSKNLSVRFGGESTATQPEPRLDMFEYPLIKHGRRGHRRRIYLTVDLGAGIIRWGNGRRWLQIEHILQVRSGKETPVLRRRAAQDVDGRLCLSLITRYRSLDLECKTVEERKAVQLTIMVQIIGYLRLHSVRAGWIRPRVQSS